ncbi:UDP-N-acetylmuramoyl-L-alanine--D-glutamate ligase [uncultured Slackia sp.]|uniref:UDP-N-acetylmuramoyl-L-alanine--D-glutamate ligase n=1 Tax=uncultured Slackia sp. TaxID=665903 RepID=UPI0025E9D0AA|nr:UDP-N-acetylmuramoyl-L-alanine--D-glutamate ligase [uncultured Slackia sp.]
MTGEMIVGRKRAARNLGDVLILGLGKSGRAAARYCLEARHLGEDVASLTIAAGEQNDGALEFAQYCESRGAKVYFDLYTFEGHYDLCIASPGISQFSRFYENASHVSEEIISEVEFAWRESAQDSRWVAVTGTNGKTTTTTLTTHILKAAHERVEAVGNIGNTCIEAVAQGESDVYVAETSSFQLASMKYFAPQAAILLNITPDHLYWHMTYENYAEAKARVFANMNEGNLAVVNVDDEGVQEVLPQIRQTGARVCEVSLEDSGASWAAFCANGILTLRRGGEEFSLVHRDGLAIKGDHNVINALCAAAAAMEAGASADAVREGLRSFRPLEHRLEPCGQIDGVNFVNDSKATNVDATLKALSAYPKGRAVFLLGGHDKGTELDDLVKAAEETCRAVVCFGAAGERFMKAFEGSSLTHVQTAHMEDALDEAISIAQPGDSVVLSPACASFDEFDSFEHRGRVFKHLVAFRAQRAER